MSHAKNSLREMGAAQFAYQASNEAGVFGTFDELRRSGDVARDDTLGNMIEKYRLTWEVNTTSTVPTEGVLAPTISTFTITAWPRDTREGYLATFAITEDQTVRVYDPDDVGSSIENPQTWDPIL